MWSYHGKQSRPQLAFSIHASYLLAVLQVRLILWVPRHAAEVLRGALHIVRGEALPHMRM